MTALPKTIKQLEEVVGGNGDIDLGFLFQPNATHSLEFLQQHGSCINNIIPKQSTNPEAGWGIFVASAFRAGEFITSSSVLHISDKNIFDMWDGGHITVIGQQLVLNYCFGRERESTMLLCQLFGSWRFFGRSQCLNSIFARRMDGA